MRQTFCNAVTAFVPFYNKCLWGIERKHEWKRREWSRNQDSVCHGFEWASIPLGGILSFLWLTSKRISISLLDWPRIRVLCDWFWPVIKINKKSAWFKKERKKCCKPWIENQWMHGCTNYGRNMCEELVFFWRRQQKFLVDQKSESVSDGPPGSTWTESRTETTSETES